MHSACTHRQLHCTARLACGPPRHSSVVMDRRVKRFSPANALLPLGTAQLQPAPPLPSRRIALCRFRPGPCASSSALVPASVAAARTAVCLATEGLTLLYTRAACCRRRQRQQRQQRRPSSTQGRTYALNHTSSGHRPGPRAAGVRSSSHAHAATSVCSPDYLLVHLPRQFTTTIWRGMRHGLPAGTTGVPRLISDTVRFVTLGRGLS